MTRRCRFWRPARGEPRPVDCGSSCVTKDHGVARHRRRPSTATRATARRNKPKRCWGCVAASCMRIDRKSTRLNSSHSQISYAVFCLKKKKKQKYSDGTRKEKKKKKIRKKTRRNI